MRPKKEAVSIRVPVPMMDQVRHIAEKTEVAVTDVLIAALHMYLSTHEETP